MRKIYDWKTELYWRLPVLLQEAALSTYAAYLDRRYYGSEYEKWQLELSNQQRWPLSQVREWQNRRLQFILEIAATRVPYYREKWRQLDWRSVISVADLSRLPLLDKHAIRQNE